MKKVKCRFNPQSKKLYAFLVDDALAANLQSGDRVFAQTARGPQEVYVAEFTDEDLSPNITYQPILSKPNES
jgi:hypothetical protein